MSKTSLIVLVLFAACQNAPQTHTANQQTATLDEMIGQMIMVGFRGKNTSENPKIQADIKERHIGGVILFDYDINLKKSRNINSPEQVKSLTRSLQRLAKTPLLIGIDQEGGKINRLKPKYGFSTSVSAQYLGNIDVVDSTQHYALKTAQTLKDIGINMNMAPVVDVNISPENPIIGKLARSFSDSPQKVTTHAATFIDAHHRENIITTLKHFPGHGSSHQDSHLGLTDVTHTWHKQELIPYRRLIHAEKVDVIMTAHIFHAVLDSVYPATLSSKIIGGLLRKDLKFDGVVISDDMQMKAISTHYGLEVAIQKALLAGVDILLFGNNLYYDPDISQKAIAIIKKLLAQRKISAERIRISYQRIMALKTKFKR